VGYDDLKSNTIFRASYRISMAWDNTCFQRAQESHTRFNKIFKPLI